MAKGRWALGGGWWALVQMCLVGVGRDKRMLDQAKRDCTNQADSYLLDRENIKNNRDLLYSVYKGIRIC